MIGDTGTTLAAGRNIAIEAATNTSRSTSFFEKKESGFFQEGLSYNASEQSNDRQGRNTTAAASTVGALQGNVVAVANNNYRQVGSDVISPQGNITISAAKVDIVEARETSRSTTEDKTSQSGFGVTFSNPVLSAIESVQQSAQAISNASKVKDSRIQALAAASTALTAYNTYNQVAALVKDPAAAASIGVNLSIGSSKSQSNTENTSNTAVGSNVAAGGDITIAATGAGLDSNLTVQGSRINAGGSASLMADNQVNLLAAINTASERNSNSNSGASLGIGFSVGAKSGFSLNASVSSGKGEGNGDEIRYTNTQVQAGNTLVIASGGDTNLIGAVAAAKQVTVQTGGDLIIQSLQDQSVYKETQSSAGAGVSLCIPPFCYGSSSGSVSGGKSNIDSNYQSVGEQSAIRAGDGGFNVAVGGNTTLAGGQITSTQKAVDDGKNSFQAGGVLTLTDIQNVASYEGSGYQLGAGLSGTLGDQSSPGAIADMRDRGMTDAQIERASHTVTRPGGGAGYGQTSGDASSTTTAGISGIAGNTGARTGDAETSLKPIFDRDKVRANIDAQIAITAAFGRSASTAWGDYANQQQAGAPDAKSAACWAEGGACRVAGHILIGGLGGGVGGAAGAGAAALAADEINKLTEDLPPVLKNLVGAGIAASIGAAAGGLTGAAAAFNEDTNNRQLNPNQISRIQQLANGSNAAVARLTIAACAIRRCADGVPPTDANYRLLSDMQAAGATDEYAAERSTLAQQTYRVGTNPSNQTSPLKLFNDYNASDSAVDAFTSSNGGIRTMGLLQALGGAGMIVAGTGACTTGFGCFLGGAGATFGWDQVVTGSNTAATGQPTLTMGEQVLQGMGLSPQAAALTYAALGLSPAAVEGILLNRTVNAQAAAYAAARNTYATNGASGGTAVAGEIATPVTSGGTANVVTVPGLKGQLAAENLANIAAQDARLAKAASGSGVPNPNFSVGSGTATEANSLGQIWVGDGARPLNGVPGGLISADGTRVFRPPTAKPNAPAEFNPTGVQANFQMRDPNTGAVISNGHMVIK